LMRPNETRACAVSGLEASAFCAAARDADST
jgi:hypothetical protein